MLKEIEQVGRLLESEQTGSCLAYIESLEKNHPNCACLTSAKLAVYRAENRWQEALTVAERFLADEPDNPTAAAEYALALVVTGNPQLAVSTLVDAFERSKADGIHSALLHAALQVGSYLLLGGFAIPAIAIGNVLKEIPAMEELANMLLYRVTADVQVPLLLRDWAFDYNCPDDFAGKATFEEAAVLVRLMRWKQAFTLLEPLTQHADHWSGIWRNIAALHFWLLDDDKGCEALKTYASLPNTPLEDAVDAVEMRILFSPDALGDQTELITAEYTITDADKAQEKLLSAPLMYAVDRPMRSETPPPRGCFLVNDRPFPDSEVPITLENVPSQQAIIVLYGKETDRDARLFVQALPVFKQEAVETTLRDVLGDLVQIPGNVLERHPTSKSRVLTRCRYCLPPEKYANSDMETIRKLFDDYNTTVFPELWVALPLGLLDGKTPSEAAKESHYTVPLLAAIQTVEKWTDEGISDVVPDLRRLLRLPELGTITVAESTDEDPLMVLDSYPVWRWHRFDVTKLSTDVLAGGLQIVASMREMSTAVRFAEELLNRPMDSMPFPVRVMAFESLISAAQGKRDFEKALLWVERAKNESAAQNVPDAAWCLHEIMLYILQGNGPAMSNAVRYLMENYQNDANVMNALQELFVQIGLVNPDGTPTAAALHADAEHKAEEQAIWTPDGNTSPGSAGASKLWVPD